ncbi:bifunctional protein-serine/threonine kinase/phosphatase [Ramlibacter sp. G-1-2-2]|uniref:Bifunctional protein-serine/threonine kinase/phosphatase n=1 Tax=Ramlibacter agri TaxID=2728837 RepID=A0A848HAL4_9BURK|nr:bifunctional protein-serine/threonine kinase/phosphatase [Ramlibacter agri]
MLAVTAGQYSDAGRKPANQDFHGLCVPPGPQRAAKGVAIALADGISSSDAGHLASAAAVRSFLDDYYCTSEAWSVKTSVERVLVAANSWLFAQTRNGAGRYDRDRGWACTLSALVLKSRTAHLFHVGDARVWQVQGKALEQLTQDHRVYAGGGQSYLGRALGIAPQLEIDYRAVPLERGDTFLLATDGVHGHVPEAAMLDLLRRHPDDLDAAARAIAEEALRRGSEDNVTVQVLRVDALPAPEMSEVARMAAELPLPPLLAPRMVFDGFRIVRELHASNRSHVYLAVDEDSGETVVLKTPSIDLGGDPAYRERFLLEEWAARRVDSPHVLKAPAPARRRNFLYVVLEYVEGRTLAQWMVDHPRPDLDAVRAIVDQLARGLRALHRLEMLHQDLRPENVMIDATGTARIIDFGAVRVAGIAEMEAVDGNPLPGTVQYMAPEYFLGGPGDARSDLFSLAAIAYHMLSGRLPYGAAVAQARSAADQRALRCQPLAPLRPDLPSWIDAALQKALQPQPHKRYQDVAEFAYALHRADPDLQPRRRVPLVERNPVAFWKAVSLALAVGWVVMLGLRVASR